MKYTVRYSNLFKKSFKNVAVYLLNIAPTN